MVGFLEIGVSKPVDQGEILRTLSNQLQRSPDYTATKIEMFGEPVDATGKRGFTFKLNDEFLSGEAINAFFFCQSFLGTASGIYLSKVLETSKAMLPSLERVSQWPEIAKLMDSTEIYDCSPNSRDGSLSPPTSTESNDPLSHVFYHCKACKLPIDGFSGYLKHTLLSHPGVEFKCRKCSKKMVGSELERHFHDAHPMENEY